MAADPALILLEQIQCYLDHHPRAVMVEGGEVVFRFDEAEFSLRPERGRCLLQVWSEERNVVRRVVAAEPRQDHLRLSVQRIDPRWVYSQVPAFAAGDRGMIDLLTVTRDGRLVVIELKAQEDLHLPLQGLDYWARVRWHHNRDDFKKFGYFAGCELSNRPPILLLVSPALHLHPATDTLLRHLSPEIDWKVLGIDEHWRWGVKVIFRKSREEGKIVTRG